MSDDDRSSTPGVSARKQAKRAPDASGRYVPALHCRECGWFLLPHDADGHDRWHKEKADRDSTTEGADL